MTEPRTKNSTDYYRQTMLIEDSSTEAYRKWFIWHNQTVIWHGPTEQAGHDYATATGLVFDCIEPLGSEPILIDDEYLDAFTKDA